MPRGGARVSNPLGDPTLAWPSGGTSAFSTYRVQSNASTSTFAKITTGGPPLPSTGSFSTGASFSPNGEWMAITMAAAQFLWIYYRIGQGNTWVNLSANLSAAAFSAGNSYWSAFHPSGRYLSSTSSATPYLATYRKNNFLFAKLANVSSLPSAGVQSAAWNAQGTSLALGLNASPWINIYNFDPATDTFTKITSPSGASATVYSLAWSPDGTKLAVGQNGSPWIKVLDRSGDTFTAESNPATTPGSNCYVQFTNDGTELIAGSSTSPYLYPYSVGSTTTTYTAATFVGGNPGGNVAGGIQFSGQGPDLFLAVGLYLTPYFCVYKKSGSTYTKLDNPGTLPAGNTNGCPVWWPKPTTGNS
jgi:WD40 repeat protein